MNRLKIGIRLESLRLPLRRALREAQRLGVRGVQADAAGDLSPHTLSQTGRSAFRHLLGSHNLELTALGCPLRRGLDSPEDQQQRIDHTKAVLGLSVDLGARIAIVQAGCVSENADDPRTLLLTEALRVLGRHGDRIGAVLALETGLESGAVLGAFLDRFDTGGLGVNLDPANLLLHDFDPCESARALQDKVVHIRATDARRASVSRSAQELPLGHGDIDWAHYLGVLEEIGYRGWLTVEREGGGNRVAGLAAGIGFLKRFVGPPELSAVRVPRLRAGPRGKKPSPLLSFSDSAHPMPQRLKAVAFDLDAASLISLQEALPEWEIELVNGATAASLSPDWSPGAADLLIVKAREDVAETLGLCRFLVSCGVFSTDSREEEVETLGPRRNGQNQERRADAPLLVLLPSGQEHLVSAALEAGAHSCLLLPIYAKEVASMLAHARAGNQPGRHTLSLEGAQREDRWRDDGGQG